MLNAHLLKGTYCFAQNSELNNKYEVRLERNIEITWVCRFAEYKSVSKMTHFI